MYIKRVDGPRQVALPDGSILSRADLPPSNTSRWVASRKATVVNAVQHGLLSRGEALARYDLSEEEFDLWCDAAARHGVKGLSIAAIKRYRQV